ncbi:MAG: hypothetical protein CR972_01700 [Candidatus Moraniibacteriota bacterium]|nr:MAG: hypothetical protein CR972_01700 [Candidatus Moranbacteria bacterium]
MNAVQKKSYFSNISHLRLIENKSSRGNVMNGEEFHSLFEQALSTYDYDNQPNKFVRLMQIISAWACATNCVRILFRKIFISQRKSFMQILWEMGRDPKHYSSFFIDRISKLNHHIKVDAASSMALDTMYDWDEKIRPVITKDSWANRFEKFWFDNSENRRSLVNRKKMVNALLVRAIDHFLNEPEVRIISVACGSARAVIDAILHCKHPNVRVVLIDRDQKALDNARKNMEAHGIRNVEYVKGTMRKISKVATYFSPHIVEMVGLTDYLTVERAADFSRTVSEVLETGGFYLTGNIHSNPEKIFLDWGLLWPMVYKTPGDLLRIGRGEFPDRKRAFKDEFVKVFCEPLGIHGLVLSHKA